MPVTYLYNCNVAGVGEMLELSLWEAFPIPENESIRYVWNSAKDADTIMPYRHTFIFDFNESLCMVNQAFTQRQWRENPLSHLWRFSEIDSFHAAMQLQTDLAFLQTQEFHRPILVLGPQFLRGGGEHTSMIFSFMSAIKERYPELQVYVCEGGIHFPSPQFRLQLQPYGPCT